MVTERTAACKKIQKAVAEAVILAFIDFDKPFEVYADASSTQIGGIITQGTKTLACHSRIPTKHQQKLHGNRARSAFHREYRTMLLEVPVVIHTDHMILVYPTKRNLRVKRWN